MVVPYLVIALWPRLATLLPKPGHWMITMRRVLGVALALTALWLLYVLKAEIALFGVVIVGACILGMLLTLYWQRSKAWSLLSRAVIIALALLAFGTALLAKTPAANEAVTQGASWQKFDEKELARYVSEGKTVFVDITADWCVNCKANKQFTLRSEAVTHCLFSKPGVIAMRADWTNPDPGIADFLKRHGRYGIPFNAVFGPAAPQGVVLPELLTPGKVLEGLVKAHAKPYTC
ncbi:MAG: thioredoxin family protein [Alphaproteobacteria bacterium]|nr:thioredoxin family protein [Alphaproteobacteria bacterium]